MKLRPFPAMTAVLLVQALTAAAMAQPADRAEAEKRAADLTAQLAANPRDLALGRQLVLLNLVALDNPAEAAKHVGEGLEPELAKYVPAAAKPVAEAPELACQEMSRWYLRLAGEAYPWARWAMYKRARAYAARYLELHPAIDKPREDAVRDLKRLDDTLLKLCADDATVPDCNRLAPNQWCDLLRLVEPAKDAAGANVGNNWIPRGANLAGLDPSHGPERLTIPVCVLGGYELEVRFLWINGDGHVGVFLPAGVGATTLKLGAKRSGLDKVNNEGLDTNRTAFPLQLVPKRAYSLAVQTVLKDDQASITAVLDARPVVRWQGPQFALTPGWNMKKDQPGLAIYGGTVNFLSVRLRPLSGHAFVSRPLADPSALAPKPATGPSAVPPRKPSASKPAPAPAKP
jgi:hypothetical protein